MLLLDAAHHHAQVLRLDHHRHAQRLERLLDAVADLDRQPLLHLQPARIGIDHARDLRQADDLAVRNVGDVRLAEKRQHVMLAQRIDLDVLDDHHLLVFFLEHRRAQNFRRLEIVAVGQELQRLGHALGRLLQALRASGSSPRSLRMARYFSAMRRIAARIVLVDLGVAVHLVFFAHLGGDRRHEYAPIRLFYSASRARMVLRMPSVVRPALGKLDSRIAMIDELVGQPYLQHGNSAALLLQHFQHGAAGATHHHVLFDRHQQVVARGQLRNQLLRRAV